MLVQRQNIKILQLGKFYPPKGGVERVMLELAEGISLSGVPCDVLCARLHNRDAHSMILEYPHCKIITARTLLKIFGTTISIQMISKLRRISSKYDIIHIHHPDPMAALALFLSGYKGKVVLHWHSDILKQKFLLHFFTPLQSWLIRRADIILGTTPTYIEHSKFLRKVQAKASYLPIGTHEMKPNQLEVEKIRAQYPGKKIILSIGRLVGYKGYEYLVRAAHYLGDDYIILIGGNGPLKSELEEIIDEENLAQKVKLLGFIPNESKDDYYGACTLFCLSSIKKTEAFAIVQVEAMSSGTPIVATNIEGSGVPWVNKHKYSGINVPTKNPKAIAEAIQEICQEDNYQGYCQRARQRYHDLFTHPEMIEGCLNIYDTLFNE